MKGYNTIYESPDGSILILITNWRRGEEEVDKYYISGSYVHYLRDKDTNLVVVNNSTEPVLNISVYDATAPSSASVISTSAYFDGTCYIPVGGLFNSLFNTDLTMTSLLITLDVSCGSLSDSFNMYVRRRNPYTTPIVPQTVFTNTQQSSIPVLATEDFELFDGSTTTTIPAHTLVNITSRSGTVNGYWYKVVYNPCLYGIQWLCPETGGYKIYAFKYMGNSPVVEDRQTFVRGGYNYQSPVYRDEEITLVQHICWRDYQYLRSLQESSYVHRITEVDEGEPLQITEFSEWSGVPNGYQDITIKVKSL